MGRSRREQKGATDLRAGLLDSIEGGSGEILELAHWMSANPELSLVEYKTSARYIDYLGKQGFRITKEVAEMETAFVAEHGHVDAPLSVALLAEMDALPEIGHACGHNLSGPASLLAASALAKVVKPDRLRVVVIGCPAEETGVGKPRLVKAGIFDGIDAAMMAHASDMRRAHRLFLGNQKYEFIFHGVASHAAAYPEKGVNALDSVIALFVAIGLLRQQLPGDVRIHGVISDGGEAPNIIPERAAAKFWIRALTESVLGDAEARVLACAKGAAEATGTQLEVVPTPGTSPPMKPNLPLASTYRSQLELLNLAESDHAPTKSIGSSDITHISRVVPTIHPNFPIGENIPLHTRAFQVATTTPRGDAGLLEGAKAMALTALEMSEDPQLLEEIARADKIQD
jgi:amidohydrolase